MTINPKISLRTFAIANELTLPPDPAEITIPYGQWPFGFREVELDGKRRPFPPPARPSPPL